MPRPSARGLPAHAVWWFPGEQPVTGISSRPSSVPAEQLASVRVERSEFGVRHVRIGGPHFRERERALSSRSSVVNWLASPDRS